MKKVVLIVALLLMIPISVSATTVITRDGDIYDGDIYLNEINGYTRYTQDFSVTSVNRLKYQSWTDGFGQMVTERIADADDDGHPYMTGVNFTCNTSYRLYIYDENHNQIGFMELVVDDLTNPTCSSDGNAGEEPTDPGTGEDGCCSCECVVDIPGWDNMMGKLDEIKSAIPPAPDWQQVSETMRDTIVPAFRQEMEDMLGTAPEPPAPPIFNNPLTGGIDEPTGSLPADFEESGFTANDLKADAEEIEFKEDESGGFELLDPIGSLPTQEEFKQNIPEEQDLQAPEVPDVSGTAPEPPAQDNIAPEPPDVTGTAPSPSEEDNIAPSPPDVTGTAPSPSEGDNIAPKPSDGENVAPTPGNSNNTAPLPGDDSGTAPVPSDDLTTAPLPGEDLTGAPIPNTE